MLHRRLLLNIILLLTVAGLAVIVMRPRPHPSPNGVVLAPGIALPSVTRISIRRKDQPTLAFSRIHDIWFLTTPLHALANPLLMSALLEMPRLRSHHRYPATGLNLASYGLDPPRATVFLGTSEIKLGKVNPLNQRRYALHDGGVYLIPNVLSTLPESPALAWVSLSLLPPNARITELKLPSLIDHTGPSASRVISPSTTHKQTAQVSALLNAWRQATALRLTPAPHSSTTNREEVRIVLSNGKRFRFLLVSTKPEFILRDPTLGVDYHLSLRLANTLLDFPALN